MCAADPSASRRSFLKTSALTGAGLAAAGASARSAASAEKVKGANERVNIALIGCGGRGSYVVRGMMELGANLKYLCDLHPDRLRRMTKFLEGVQKGPVQQVKQMRTVLDDKDVDAVIVATPDHWHATATILACQAGKDVYVEKPHSYSMWENTKMVEAAAKYKRVVQTGMQNRSAPYNLKAREYVKSGKLGKIGLVKVYNMKSGGPFKLGSPGTCPDGFDWNTWLGRAPKIPYHQHIFHGGWHQFWQYSNGDMADDGIHQLDLALMLMGDPPQPKSVRSLGVRYVHKGDDSERPDTQNASWDFGTFIMTCDVTGWPRYMLKTTSTIRRNDILPYWTHNATRIELYGTQLMMTVGRHGGGWIVQTSGGKVVDKMFGRVPDPWHYTNFLECVKSRKQPNASIAIAHLSNATMHMANIAHRVGNVHLNYDAKTEKFDNEDANKLFKPTFRKGFEIPDEV